MLYTTVSLPCLFFFLNSLFRSPNETDGQTDRQTDKERDKNSLFFASPWHNGPPGVLGIWGEGLFIFRELGSTANYFRGAGEQAHTFGDLGSTAKK